MIRGLFFLLSLSLVGCTPLQIEPRLEGVWTSEKEMTLSRLNRQSLTEEQLDFLERSLGDLQYTFRNGKVAMTFLSDREEPEGFSRYKVYESNDNFLIVGHKRVEKLKINFYENCFYIETDWGFNEFFCKSEKNI